MIFFHKFEKFLIKHYYYQSPKSVSWQTYRLFLFPHLQFVDFLFNGFQVLQLKFDINYFPRFFDVVHENLWWFLGVGNSRRDHFYPGAFRTCRRCPG